jgi:hypothetical protein
MIKNPLKAIALLCWIFTFAASQLCAQNKILLLNGKLIDAESYSLGDIFLNYKRPGDARTAPRLIDRYDVFSIQRSDSTEEIIYLPADSLDYSIEEARLYIKGEQLANMYYNRPSVKWSSAAVGIGSSILNFYALPVPMIYSLVLGRFNPRNIQVPEEYSYLKQNEAFQTGYKKAGRNIKIQQSLKWGYVSLGLGIAGFLVFK